VISDKPNTTQMIIDHICIAVKDLAEGIRYWKEIFGYRQMTEPVINTRQKVKVVFLKKDQSLPVKLIEPLQENLTLINFVEQGGGFHHICFKCDDLEGEIKELKTKGVRMLVPPQPGEAFENNNIAFFWAKNRINFELIDTDEKAKILL
jgi:methylmalonyl-CoA/ethylmalonyl-CoA epimerase